MAIGKIIASVGVVALILFGIWAAAPLFYDKEISEELPIGAEASPSAPINGSPIAVAETSLNYISAGEFVGFDRLHQASGMAKLVEVDGKKYIRFEENFTVTNGPDLFVHLGKDSQYAAEANLGRLKGNLGSQNYEIPDSLNVDEYDSVWIWCRAFSVPFGKAVLTSI